MRLSLTRTTADAFRSFRSRGLVARRIVPFVREGEAIAAGQRIGMIRFGSRVDVYLPPATVALVVEGQTATAGETVLADFSALQAEPMVKTELAGGGCGAFEKAIYPEHGDAPCI